MTCDRAADLRQPRLLAILIAIAAAALLALWTTAAWADRGGPFLYIHACDGGHCRTYALPVLTCAAGGSISLAVWKSLHLSHYVRAWICLDEGSEVA